MDTELRERDAWDDLGDQGNGISGEHLKCAKGVWLLNDESIDNDGLKIVVIMDTAAIGQVLWLDKKIAERETGLVAEGFVAPRELKDGWNPYVSFQCVRVDDGGLLTFTSSSWGGRYAFQSLVNPYRLRRRAFFPICTLGTKERRDENRNIDPVFKIVGWGPRDGFPDLLAPALPAITHEPTATAPALAELVSDEIPF